MEKINIKIFGKCESKLHTVKLVKEYSGLNLKKSKDLCDLSWNNNKPIEFNIYKKDLKNCKKDFSDIGLELQYIDREKKMKRILYSDQAICIKDMLTDASKWDTLNLITDDDKEKLTYNQCKEKAIEIIFNKYSKYLKSDIFMKLYNKIGKINKLETKQTEIKFIKFNEEFGEMCAEYIKLKGFTYKSYDKEKLVEKMADTLQVLLSIYSNIEKETDIFLSDVIEKIKERKY